jgi:hypothetical protein
MLYSRNERLAPNTADAFRQILQWGGRLRNLNDEGHYLARTCVVPLLAFGMVVSEQPGGLAAECAVGHGKNA